MILKLLKNKLKHIYKSIKNLLKKNLLKATVDGNRSTWKRYLIKKKNRSQFEMLSLN